MSKLPFKLEPISDERKRFHSSWLCERQLDLELSKEAVERFAPEAEPLLDDETIVAQCDPSVRVGQIRLLGEELCEDAKELRYIAIIDENEDNASGLCIPFSRYSDPATKDEWRSPFEATPLKVLQFWNAHAVPLTDLAQNSWTACEMEAAELSVARQIYAAVVSGAWLPLDLRNQTGTPIFRPDDIRLQYQAEERKSFLKMDACMGAYMELLQQWRGWDRNVIDESLTWEVPELLAAARSNRRIPIRIEYRSGDPWDGVAVQIDSFSDDGVYEIRWEVMDSSKALRPGCPVLISSENDAKWQTVTRSSGNLIILRIQDQEAWDDLRSGKSKVTMLVYAKD